MRFSLKLIPRSVRVWFLAMIVILSVLLPSGYGVLAEDSGVSDLSLYQRASELTREFATALAPGSGTDRMYMLEKTTDEGYLVAGNAGAFLGYADILSDDTGIVGWLMNSYTTASATITYDQLMYVVGDGSDNVSQAARNNPFFQYAGYGEVLTDMGLISTIRPGMSGMLRTLGTGLIILTYLLANAAPFLFRAALMLLTTLNPFKLFETVVNGTAAADLGILSGVAEYVGSLYSAVQSFSIVFLFPMMLATTAFMVLILNKGGAMKRFARYGVRVFMLFAGLPLIGATYTGLIEDLDSKVSVGSEYADYLVLSSYVDFESWAKYSRLAPPLDVGIKHPRFNDNEERTISNRELILNINGSRANSDRAYALKDRYLATSDIGQILEEGGKRKDADSDVMTGDQKSSFSDVMSLLTRHMTSATYTSSDYNGEVSGQIQKIRTRDTSEENNENIVKMFSLSASDSRTWTDKLNVFSDDAEWMKPIYWNGKEGEGENDGDDNTNSAKGLFTEGAALNDIFKFGKYKMNIYNSGDLRYDREKGYITSGMPEVMDHKTNPIGETRAETAGGLSPISMYNFLNTTFSNTGLTVYSPQKTSSDLSRDAYAAVTFGGSGISSVTRWLENLTVMFSLAVLSIAYGIMMISVAIKNIPRILSGVFGTALGSIAYTTKLLISVGVLILQVIGMIFFYALSENIIMAMLLNFNNLVDSGSNYFSGAGLILDFLSSFMITAITAALTIFMIRNVKVFKEMMEEIVTNSITRLMGALDVNTGGKGLDVSNMSGGRVGGDGKLTDAARQADTGLLGGAAGLLGTAHDLESQREQIAQEKAERDGKEPPTSSLATKLKNRAGTAMDLAGAKGKDMAKGVAGIQGKSLAREVDAKQRMLQSLLYNNDREAEPIGETDMNPSVSGQPVDENGNLISANAPVAMYGSNPVLTNKGALTDADGNLYTDEKGQPFHQNEKGQLVDENGKLVALDKDGTLQPLAAIPGHNGKPVSALKEAKKLDDMRFDAEKYGAMKQEQDATHYGLDKDGNVVGTDGKSLQVNGANGLKPARLDSQGFVTDADGKRVAAADVDGSVDARGFKRVTDPKTGETHLKHKGDSAMKNAALPKAVSGKGKVGTQNLQALAKQSDRAKVLADRASQKVEELKANGASPYVVKQAERYADKMSNNAQKTQQVLNKATARHEQAQATQRVENEPRTTQRAPEGQSVPKRSTSKSYAELTAAGVNNYDDYRQQVAKHTTDLKKNQSRLKQAEQRLATLRSSNRPPQIIDQAENQVKVLQRSVKDSQSNVKKLKDNAQGLLKNGHFQPAVANRPIRQNGLELINQMNRMNQTQAMYDKLSYQEKSGTITEAGRKQLKSLGGRLNHMRRDLVSSGIREDAIRDKSSITKSTKQLQHSWDSFVNGTSADGE